MTEFGELLDRTPESGFDIVVPLDNEEAAGDVTQFALFELQGLRRAVLAIAEEIDRIHENRRTAGETRDKELASPRAGRVALRRT